MLLWFCSFSFTPKTPVKIFDMKREIPARMRQSETRRSDIQSPRPDPTTATNELPNYDDNDNNDRGVSTRLTLTSVKKLTKVLGSSQSTSTRLARALRVRDILSTFDRNEFPLHHISEEVCRRVAFLEEPKAIADCLEQGDLKLTVFELAVNNSAQYDIFCQLLSEDRCAQFFEQKLRRRIEAQIAAFDMLAKPDADVLSASELQSRIDEIAFELSNIVQVATLDRKRHLQGEREKAKHLVSLLREVCCRSRLFQALIGNASSVGPGFGLDALGVLSNQAVMERSGELAEVRALLVQQGTPNQYLTQFDELTDGSME